SHFGKLAIEHGVTVWGLAPQGTAVNKLGDTLRRIDPNAKSLTIESFVGQVNFGSLKIPENTCLILDESSQVDTLELAETIEIAAKFGAKLILVGDDRQLGSVRYGGMFAALFAKLGGARMVETRRAADAYDRTAQSYLRMGNLKEALRIYDQSG
ncbi:conjugative transfer protein TraA, partial [mine drainage metagenome]